MYNQREEIKNLAASWWNRDGMFNDHEVIVHGDATPTNFLFHHQKVTGIDLEKMKWADRCWDLGFIAAELKHHYMWRAGDGKKAEPFIGHFLWEYATRFRRYRHFLQNYPQIASLYGFRVCCELPEMTGWMRIPP